MKSRKKTEKHETFIRAHKVRTILCKQEWKLVRVFMRCKEAGNVMSI